MRDRNIPLHALQCKLVFLRTQNVLWSLSYRHQVQRGAGGGWGWVKNVKIITSWIPRSVSFLRRPQHCRQPSSPFSEPQDQERAAASQICFCVLLCNFTNFQMCCAQRKQNISNLQLLFCEIVASFPCRKMVH